MSTPSDNERTMWVWDAPVRVFHWLMVACFAGAWITADSERWRLVHETLGETMIGLAVWRVVWGVVGMLVGGAGLAVGIVARDEAALRRFTFKIRFKPLTAEQREHMFVTEALDGQADALTDDARRRLARLEQLCPGDFAAVKRQVDILASRLTPEEFLEQLESEHRIKPEVREQRSMGFLH